MEKEYMTDTEQRKTERLILIIYTLYNVAMMVRTVTYGWDNWLNFMLLLGITSSWIIYISKFKNYVFRAKFTTVMLELSLLIYSHVAAELTGGIPLMVAFIIFLCLYERLEIVYLTILFSAIMFVYHGAMLKTIPLSGVQDALTLLVQVANVAVVEVVAYIWVKKKNASDRRAQGVIKELQMAQRSKDEFLANVSHEIRTPINTICGMSEILLQEEFADQVKEKLLDIKMSGQNLLAVVSNMLDFSELQSGKMELEEESYKIKSTINDLITLAQALKADKKIELIVDCNANIPSTLYGDEKKLRRIILNLMDNAIKFTEEGYVRLGLSFRKESYGINLIITVKDTGIGIAEESIKEILTGLHQVDASSTRSGSGIGLGLAISRSLIRRMGGTITMNSTKGKGTTVVVVIPQKVIEETPLASIQDKKGIKVATYIDLEKFNMSTIRDEYSLMIERMIEQLKGNCHICRNFAELQRRQEKESFSHIFVGIEEYLENKSYFENLSQSTYVAVILDYAEEKRITNPNVLKIFKPFYALSIASVLNGTDYRDKTNNIEEDKFITKNVHVLVVDDNRMNLRVAESLLSRYGIAVTLAGSGREALVKIESCNYDFVFMDHMMPEMDGVETLQQIRQKVGAYYKKVPIIALTANAVAGTREMLLSMGFSDFLEKPIENSVLERVLRRNLPEDKIVIAKTEVEQVEETMTDEIQMPKEAVETQKSLLELLEQEGLNTQKGIMYCGGEEPYIEILQSFCEDSRETYQSVQELFENEDWENYTIMVHGIKSAMGSIGAEDIQELARQLEFAGKENKIEFILQENSNLLTSYKGLFKRLAGISDLGVKDSFEAEDNTEVLEDMVELRVLRKDEFADILEEMESAMYSLDGDLLLELLDGIKNCQYEGKPLTEVVKKAVRKVEMFDYMSAVEMLANQMTVQTSEE